MSMTGLILSAMTRTLPMLSRAADLEESRNSICFEDAGAKRLLRFELGRPKDHVWVIAFEYSSRPTVKGILDRGLPNPAFDSAAFGPLPLRTERDAERLLRLLTLYARHPDLLDFGDPFRSRFLDALAIDEPDTELARKTLRHLLSQAIFDLRADIPKSELALPFGTLSVQQDAGYVSRLGSVPPFARLSLDQNRKGSASGWLKVETIYFVPGIYVSPRTRDGLLVEMFEEALRSVRSGEPWELAKGSGDDLREVLLILRDDALALRPSKEYALHLNRGRTSVTRMLAGLDSRDWMEVYERLAATHDELTVLEGKIRERPDQFEHYKALADFHASRGDAAKSNLVLGIGYLRARKVPGIARAKLNLAAQANPNCPGLTEAFAELDSFELR